MGRPVINIPIDIVYKKALSLIKEEGLTITSAFKKCGYDPITIRNRLSESQRMEIKLARAANNFYGCRPGSTPNYMQFDTSFEGY